MFKIFMNSRPWASYSVTVATAADRLACNPRLSLVRMMSSNLQKQFDDAKKKVDSLKEDPGNAAKLRMYALFKQANAGKCNTKRPAMVDFVGKAKWDAWNSLGDMSQDEAKQAYVKLIDELAGKDAETSSVEAQAGSTSSEKYTELIYTKTNKIATIMLNRPKKKNAITLKMYTEISDALLDAANDDNVSFAVMTGAGDYYCSGNDLKNLTSFTGDIGEAAKNAGEFLRKYVNSYIDFPKPLVAVVNGSAVGVAVTVLGLFDLVYAVDTATFHTPFSALGQSPEGCSSYTFPMLMGTAKANELLMLGRLISAVDAKECGLVTEVFPEHSFRKETSLRLANMAKLPARSLLYAKQVNRNVQKEILYKINKVECDNLVERWQSDDCMKAITAFFSKQSKM